MNDLILGNLGKGISRKVIAGVKAMNGKSSPLFQEQIGH